MKKSKTPGLLKLLARLGVLAVLLLAPPGNVARSAAETFASSPLPPCPEDRHTRHIEPSPFFEQDRTLYLIAWRPVVIWRSSNNGLTWSQVFMTYGGTKDFEITPLPGSPNHTLYLLYNYAGTYPLVRSTDGGETWQERAPCHFNCVDWSLRATNQPDAIFLTRARIYPYTGPTPGVLRSSDGGLIWQLVWEATVWDEIGAWSAEPSPNFANDQTVFAPLISPSQALDTYLIASTDGGETWEARGQQGLCDAPLDQLLFSPGYVEDRTLFALQRGSIFKSEDGGFSWRHLYPLGQPPCEYHDEAEAVALQLSPDYPSDRTLFISTYGGTLYASYDDGYTWLSLAQADRIYPFSVRRRPEPTLTAETSQATSAPLASQNWPMTHPGSSTTPLASSLYLPLVAVVQPPPVVHSLYLPLLLAHGPLPRPLTIFMTTGWIRHSHYRSDDGGLTWQCLNVPPEFPWARRTRP